MQVPESVSTMQYELLKHFQFDGCYVKDGRQWAATMTVNGEPIEFVGNTVVGVICDAWDYVADESGDIPRS